MDQLKKKGSAEPGTAHGTPVTGLKEQHKADAPFGARSKAVSFGYKSRCRLRVTVFHETDLTHARHLRLSTRSDRTAAKVRFALTGMKIRADATARRLPSRMYPIDAGKASKKRGRLLARLARVQGSQDHPFHGRRKDRPSVDQPGQFGVNLRFRGQGLGQGNCRP